MLPRLWLTGIALALAACGPESAAPRATLTLTAQTGAAAPRRKLSCDELVPRPMRDAYMPGTQMTETSLAARTVMCSANQGGRSLVHVRYDCRSTTTLAQWQDRARELRRTHSTFQPVAGVGRDAIGTGDHLELYDDDADCVLEVIRYDGKPVLALARELTRALEPALLPPVEKGKFTLRCDKLLPEALRNRFAAGSRLEASAIAADAMECRLRYDDLSADVVTYNCGRPYSKEMIAEMKAQYDRNRTRVEEASVGAAGLYLEMMGAHSVAFVDSDLGCLVNVLRTRGDGQKALELAQAADEALSAASAR